MKVWIHQIQESMNWQERNYKLLKNLHESDPTQENLNAYIESYGLYRELKGKYSQWHIDAREAEELQAA